MGNKTWKFKWATMKFGGWHAPLCYYSLAKLFTISSNGKHARSVTSPIFIAYNVVSARHCRISSTLPRPDNQTKFPCSGSWPDSTSVPLSRRANTCSISWDTGIALLVTSPLDTDSLSLSFVTWLWWPCVAQSDMFHMMSPRVDSGWRVRSCYIWLVHPEHWWAFSWNTGPWFWVTWSTCNWRKSWYIQHREHVCQGGFQTSMKFPYLSIVRCHFRLDAVGFARFQLETSNYLLLQPPIMRHHIIPSKCLYIAQTT